jgi:hypothetical protein
MPTGVDVSELHCVCHRGTNTLRSMLKKILVAASPKTVPILMRALATHFEPTVCTELSQMQAFLKTDFFSDLVLCEVYFDEGRMFDLIRSLKTDPRAKSIPVLCVKAIDWIPSSPVNTSIASRALGSEGFADLYEWRMQLGDELAFETLQNVVNILMK